MRLYSFVNSYLSSIQKGIQTAHVVGELSKGYQNPLYPQDNIFEKWLYTSPTISVLEGGDDRSLENFLLILNENTQYPWAFFREESLKGSLTVIGIILPEDWSNTAKRKTIASSKPDSFRRFLAEKLLSAKAAV